MGSSASGLVRLSGVFVGLGLVFFGCSNDGTRTREHKDAAPADPGSQTARSPTSKFDAGVVPEGNYCAMLVEAECDGDEDCDGGQICCGTLNGGAALQYDSIKCKDTCDAADGGRRLCHPGELCPGETDAGLDASTMTCARSVILPTFLAICLVPSPLLPNVYTGEPAAAHEINCGSGITCGAGTKCCVLGNWDSETQSVTTRDGYCAPLDEECNCSNASSDAG